MADILKLVKNEIREMILSAAGRAVADGDFPPEPLPDFSVEVRADRNHGVMECNE